MQCHASPLHLLYALQYKEQYTEYKGAVEVYETMSELDLHVMKGQMERVGDTDVETFFAKDGANANQRLVSCKSYLGALDSPRRHYQS